MPEPQLNEFIVQEMIKTSKVISNRLQKDFLIIALILLYIFLIQKIPLPAGGSLDYNEFGTKIVVLIALFILYISITAHLFKIYILYRKIDNSIKSHYFPASQRINNLDEREIDSASSETSFFISDNFISDLIVSGHKRHPSIQRTVFLNILFTIFLTIISFIIINDLSSNIFTWYYVLILPVISISIFLTITDFFFVKRSAFLQRSEIGHGVIEYYKRIMSYPTGIFTDEHKKLLDQLNNQFSPLKSRNIFDRDEYIFIIKSGITELEKIFSKEETDTPYRRDIKERIKKTLEHLTRFQETTDYTLAIDYHSNKKFLKPINNIFSFVYYALKK